MHFCAGANALESHSRILVGIGRIAEEAQCSNHIDSPITRESPSTNFVTSNCALALGRGDRFALSFVRNARQAVHD